MRLGDLPDPAHLPTLPTFNSTSSPLDLLVAAAAASHGGQGEGALEPTLGSLTKPGPHNPAASLPPKIVKRVLDLEFVEMSELKGDIWVDDPAPSDTGNQPRRLTRKPPVTDIKVWLECYARMAAILATRFPLKAPELWAYQSTIVKAAHNYEGANWVAYDCQFRRDTLARKDLNWSRPIPVYTMRLFVFFVFLLTGLPRASLVLLGVFHQRRSFLSGGRPELLPQSCFLLGGERRGLPRARQQSRFSGHLSSPVQTRVDCSARLRL